MAGRARWSRGSTALGALSLVLAGVLTAAPGAAQEPEPEEPRPEPTSAERLFQRDCAVCHGPEGAGTNRGPSIVEAGTAGAHFMLTTGRMPISDPEQPIRAREPAYTEEQIDALVDHVATFVDGPEAVDDVPLDEILVAEGGKLFRANCAACHQFVGVGGVLVDSKQAPSLHDSTPVEVIEAIRYGPGTMPKFSERDLDEEQVRAIATFVELEAKHPRDEGGIALGHFGPWSEGFVAWLVGIGGVLLLAGWIGKRT